MSTKPIKLNLGCGTDKREGYLNVDISPLCQPDKVWNLEKEIPLPDESVSEIIAHHVIEHLEFKKIMKEIHRVLVPGGIFYVALPFAGHCATFALDHKAYLKARDLCFYEPDNPYHYSVAPVSFKVLSIKYSHGYRKLLLPFWIIGSVVQYALNHGSARIREIYECYLAHFFPLREFQVKLKKV